MTKFKKEYKHESKVISEACGFNDDFYMEIFLKGIDTYQKTESISETVEEIEKYCHEYDPEIFRRFLIIQFVSYIQLKGREHHMEDLIEMFHGIMGGGKDQVLVFEKDKSGKPIHIETINKSDDPKLFDKIIKAKCDTCDKKDTCDNLDKIRNECINSTKH